LPTELCEKALLAQEFIKKCHEKMWNKFDVASPTALQLSWPQTHNNPPISFQWSIIDHNMNEKAFLSLKKRCPCQCSLLMVAKEEKVHFWNDWLLNVDESNTIMSRVKAPMSPGSFMSRDAVLLEREAVVSSWWWIPQFLRVRSSRV
jgi:hypothetical protein